MKIAAVLNDAGSSNLILSYLDELNVPIDILASGPAIELLSKSRISFKLITFHDICNSGYDVIFLGLSFPSNIDLQVTQALQTSETLLVTFLDHWSFSESDFRLQTKMFLPDMLVTADKGAFDRAVRYFPGTSVVQIENFYLNACLREYSNLPQINASQNSILYLAEPLDVGKNQKLVELYGSDSGQYLEFRVFEYMKSRIPIFAPHCTEIVIRPHPLQSKEMFGTEYNSGNYKVSVSEEHRLVRNIHSARVVVGIHTMALVVAQYLGKETYTCLPPGSGECAIQGVNIKYLRDFRH